MTLFLRDDKDNTLIEVEVFIPQLTHGDKRYGDYVELRSEINVKEYSKFLLNNVGKKRRIIDQFHNLTKLRGWMWSRYFMKGENDGSQLNDVIDKVKIVMEKVALDNKLTLVTD